MQAANITYLWFGKELCGKTGRNDNSEAFPARIGELAQIHRATLMRAEENLLRCHRKQLLAKPLTAQGVDILHIRGDGSLITDAALTAGQDA